MRSHAEGEPGGAQESAPRAFPDTRWSQVALVGGTDPARAHRALEHLCQAYWQPIYTFLRRKGFSPHDAEDSAQQFFLRILQRNSVPNADRSKGRFRNFLLGALNHFLTDEFRKGAARKRGGAPMPFEADFTAAEQRYLLEPDPNLTPEQMYDRRWAEALLQRTFVGLAAEFESAGQQERFNQLKLFLASEPAAGDYDRLASRLEMTPRAVGAAVYRMRQRYRELVRNQVADTVAGTQEIEAELTQLFG